MANEQETVLAAKASFDGKLEGANITLQGRFRGDLKASGLVRILEGSVGVGDEVRLLFVLIIHITAPTLHRFLGYAIQLPLTCLVRPYDVVFVIQHPNQRPAG